MGFLLQVLTGMLLGVVVGICFGSEYSGFINTWIAPIGVIFLRLIKMMVIPLVFSSLIVGISGLGDIHKFGRIGGKTFFLYTLTTVIASCLAVGVAVLVEPGVGLSLQVPNINVKEIPSVANMLIDWFPSNPVRAMAEENMMQIIVFSLAIGIGVLVCGEKVKIIADFAGQMAKVCYKIVGYIMKGAPLGVFGLITPVVVQNGATVFMPLAKLIVCAYMVFFLHAVLVYGSLLRLVKIQVTKYLKKIFPVICFAFSNCSSGATLPVSITYCRWINISKEVASFVLPLGATINMDGSAIYEGVCAVFIAQIYGIDLSLSQYILILVMSTIVSIGVAGVPGGAMVMLTMTLTAVGLPAEGIALVAGIDRILDMGLTTLNVTGDTVVSCVVAKSEGEQLDI
ncbi:MAG: dicarboxylate/amino acid:cation symporter [Acidaminococcaceae bacterium]|nr:dicarboxylate/amino acid:cation symporter [Acidaminococcaceae bacterium]